VKPTTCPWKDRRVANRKENRPAWVAYLSRLAALLASVVVLGGVANCSLEPALPITPPHWLHGSWSGSVYGTGEVWNWEFTERTVVWSTANVTLDFIQYQQNDFVTLTMLENTAEEYCFEVIEDGELFTFRFVRVSDTTLNYYDSYNGVTRGPAVFYRN
jgi:hypothetical protein